VKISFVIKKIGDKIYLVFNGVQEFAPNSMKDLGLCVTLKSGHNMSYLLPVKERIMFKIATATSFIDCNHPRQESFRIQDQSI
jgi:hypothetical protein